MKTIPFLTIALAVFCNSVAGQIRTEIYNAMGDVFKKYPELTIPDKTKIPQADMPYFDNAELIKEDELNKGKNMPFRFGKSNEVNLSIKDGIWTKTDSKAIWSLIVHSKNAFSINIILSELFLPENSSLFLYDADGTMVYGPITSDFNFEGEDFLCDIIRGEYLILRIISSNEDVPKVKLGIKNVVHGYRNLFPSQSKSSGGCNNNIECFTDWKIESNAISRVLLTGGTILCSGSLINNTSSTFHPYFLTAFHCIDIAGGNIYSEDWDDGVLQQYEIDDVYDMSFRFDYKYTTCEGSTVASYVTFNHATFRSAWYTTDFALVELNSSSVNTTAGITLLGWNRTGNTPSEGVGIHHPDGDVMKISFDDDNLSETNDGSDSGSNYWRVEWDDGVTEGGSSGSPLLDQNKRVIGQLSGGWSGCGSGDMRDWYGCFYRSWTGGGTNTTRLSNWLDPGSTGVNTLNSTLTLTGSDFVCSSGAQYTLGDLPPGSSITWSPSANLTRYSAQGSNPCTFIPYQQGAPGTIDASISFDGNSYSVIDKSVWVGVPATLYDITCESGEPGYVGEPSSFSVSPGGSVEFNWDVYPTADIFYNYLGYARINWYTSGEHVVYVNSYNECGSSNTVYYYIDVYEGFLLSPNPASDEVVLTVAGFDKMEDPNQLFEVIITDMSGVLQSRFKFSGEKFTIPVYNLKNGTYILNINDGKKKVAKQLIVIH